MLSAECVRVVCGGIPETTELLRSKFGYIFYTGSGNVGKIIGAAAAKNITPCTLELGGKSPVYMDESCDMKMAVKRLIWGKTCNAGQVDNPDYSIFSIRKFYPALEYLRFASPLTTLFAMRESAMISCVWRRIRTRSSSDTTRRRRPTSAE